MDRNSVNADRLSKEYKNGVTDICEHVAKHVKDTRFILCPCQKCLNIVEVDGIANLVGEAPGYFLVWPANLVSMKLEIKRRQKTSESIGYVSSRQLGYPLLNDVGHDGVLVFVRLAIMFDRVTNIQVDMGPYWNLNPWIVHINKENVLEVLDAQWLSASSLAFYIRYLCEVFLSKNPDMAAKFSFVSPHIVSHLVDNSNSSLAKCLLNYVGKDHLLFVPYNVG
ncbi:hypothetical protein POM88_019867 [Heracleum sosnowskyi]|uniref:Transposase-associated domain-containing protein n=1 Tax=Heracleum sosnowskyi TaxID=360622 RepID=A0AAD8IAB7_9APIA|nr:hypothetical protein POM88_019867 [Heracleum sosnowskyi]